MCETYSDNVANKVVDSMIPPEIFQREHNELLDATNWDYFVYLEQKIAFLVTDYSCDL